MARCPIPVEFPKAFTRAEIIKGILETALFQFRRCALVGPLHHNAVYERRVRSPPVLWDIPLLQFSPYRL